MGLKIEFFFHCSVFFSSSGCGFGFGYCGFLFLVMEEEEGGKVFFLGFSMMIFWVSIHLHFPFLCGQWFA